MIDHFTDVETTGNNPKYHAIVEIAGIIEVDGVVTEQYQYFVRPHKGAHVNGRVLAMIGKTPEEVAGYPPAEEVFKKIRSLYQRYVGPGGPFKMSLCNHRTKFDYDFLRAFFERFGCRNFKEMVSLDFRDTAAETRLLSAAGVLSLPDYHLETIAGFWGIKYRPHSAYQDMLTARRIFKIHDRIMSQSNIKEKMILLKSTGVAVDYTQHGPETDLASDLMEV